jgi:cytochrome b pre-mRNA-processing protein 3
MPLPSLTRLFQPRPDPREALRPLWHRVVERSRDPAWYRDCGVADTVGGRFDMIAAILSLVLLRLEREPETADSQAFLTELFVEDMDGQLRESGVGDLVVGKHVGRLVSALGGRLGAFRTALARGNGEAWRAVLVRNIALTEAAEPSALADRLFELCGRLAEAATDTLLAGELPQ